VHLSPAAQRDAEASRRAFATSSAEVVSTLEPAIQHEDDLVVNAAAFIASHPDASNTEFVRWGRSVRAMERYPELQGAGRARQGPAGYAWPSTTSARATPRSPTCRNFRWTG
jgi:hypothetical protein